MNPKVWWFFQFWMLEPENCETVRHFPLEYQYEMALVQIALEALFEMEIAL